MKKLEFDKEKKGGYNVRHAKIGSAQQKKGKSLYSGSDSAAKFPYGKALSALYDRENYVVVKRFTKWKISFLNAFSGKKWKISTRYRKKFCLKMDHNGAKKSSDEIFVRGFKMAKS